MSSGSPRTFLTEWSLEAWLARAALFSAWFATYAVAIPADAVDQSRVIGTIVLILGIPSLPGVVVYMLLGGVHESALSEAQAVALTSLVAGAFWATMIPVLRAWFVQRRAF